jgi:SAM-dependent methyltransferase
MAGYWLRCAPVMSSAIEPAIVLAAYAEPVASGRRVLFIGPAISALPERLLERGARLVHVCDPDPVRVAEATAKNRSSNVSFSALADGHFALRDGAFDVCVVENAGITDPVALVKKIRRALTPRGVAVLASPNPETRVPLLAHRPSGVISLDYYALYDAVKTEFEHVRMLGQAPFVGYVIADFAPEGVPEPSLDTAFLPAGAEEPEMFIAVASQQPVELEAFSVVQLPYRSVITGGSSSDADALRRSRGEALQMRTKLTEVEAALATEKQAVVTRDTQLREAETRVFARDAELLSLRQELDNKNQQLKAHESSLAELNAKLKNGPSAEEANAAAADLAALEQTLAERGEHIRKLERELREAERIGKELVRQLPGVSPDRAADEARNKAAVNELAQKLAKSQADLIPTRWALEAAVKRGGGGATDSPSA